MSAAKHFQVTLTRSGAGRPDTQRRTLAGLGLTRVGRQVLLRDTPAVRGMLFKVAHMVQVVPVAGELPRSVRAGGAQR